MGLGEQLGVSGLGGGVNVAGVGQTVITILAVVFFLVVVGAITFFVYFNKLKKKQFRFKIHIFRDVSGQLVPVDMDVAKEIIVPDTNVGLFYLQKRKIYIARPTRSMGLDSFWYKILANGEWVNFDIGNAQGDASKAELDYDHRDTRYAYINLKEIIKRNYTDKTVKWWKEYAPIITFVVIAFVFILGLWILLVKTGGLITKMGEVARQMGQATDAIKQALETSQNINSGIVGATV